jgi:hypothetical protein
LRDESGLDHRVEATVGKTLCISVPRCGNSMPDADDLVALIVPRVEEELRVLGDHAPPQSLQDGALVDEREIRSRKAVRVREFAGSLGTRREVESHVGESVARRPNVADRAAAFVRFRQRSEGPVRRYRASSH